MRMLGNDPERAGLQAAGALEEGVALVSFLHFTIPSLRAALVHTVTQKRNVIGHF